MANESVQAQTSAMDIERLGAPPVLGNYTGEAHMHLWCAESLATIIAGDGREAFDQLHDDIRDGALYLLACELRRARQALDAEHGAREEQGASHG